MPGRIGKFRHFARSTRGIAATEFALVLPLLLVLLLGFYDAMTAIAIYTKTRYATATLAEVANGYTTIHDDDLTQIIGATGAVLAPYSSTPVSVSVSQIKTDGSGNSTVNWSNTLTAGGPYTLPSGLAVRNTYLLYCQVSYTFTPVFGFFSRTALTLSDSIYVSPRNSASIIRISP